MFNGKDENSWSTDIYCYILCCLPWLWATTYDIITQYYESYCDARIDKMLFLVTSYLTKHKYYYLLIWNAV